MALYPPQLRRRARGLARRGASITTTAKRSAPISPPHLEACARSSRPLVLDLSGARVRLERRPALPDARARKQAQRAARAASWSRRRSRWWRRSSRSAASTWCSQVFPTMREALASVSPAGRGRPSTRAKAHARSLLGYARLDPGRRSRSADMRDKLAQALVPASGRASSPTARRTRSRSRSCPSRSATPSAATRSCVELETGQRRILRLRHGQRRAAFGEHVLARQGGRPATRERLHVARALGPHHGLPLLRAGLRARARASASTAATTCSSTPSACSSRRRASR